MNYKQHGMHQVWRGVCVGIVLLVVLIFSVNSYEGGDGYNNNNNDGGGIDDMGGEYGNEEPLVHYL